MFIYSKITLRLLYTEEIFEVRHIKQMDKLACFFDKSHIGLVV